MAIAQPKVAIFGGDPVVREAIEALLQAAGYQTRLPSEPVGYELDKLLANFNLLLVAPGLSAECRKGLLDMLSSPATLAKIRVLELLTEGEEQIIRRGHVLLWPCSREELERTIDALLTDAQA
jgi:hypothetical protein